MYSPKGHLEFTSQYIKLFTQVVDKYINLCYILHITYRSQILQQFPAFTHLRQQLGRVKMNSKMYTFLVSSCTITCLSGCLILLY